MSVIRLPLYNNIHCWYKHCSLVCVDFLFSVHVCVEGKATDNPGCLDKNSNKVTPKQESDVSFVLR